jgi:hypothetical protein
VARACVAPSRAARSPSATTGAEDDRIDRQGDRAGEPTPPGHAARVKAGGAMHEYIEIQFRRKDRPLRVARQVPGGIEFDEPDPIPRAVHIGFDAADEVTRYRMRRVRQLQGWEPHQFSLLRSVEDGAIVLRGVTPFGLPEGRYTLGVHVQEAKTRAARKIVKIVEDGHAVFVVQVESDDRQVAVDLTGADSEILRVLEASALDGEDAATWLAGDARPERKACLLNLLASLRVRPTLSAPLIAQVIEVVWAGRDRVFAKVEPELMARAEGLASDPRRPFYREGFPRAPIHLKLLDAIPAEIRDRFDPKVLCSFRSEGRPSLQMVIAAAPPGLPLTYAEFDLDLANPLQDVAGVVVHLGELLDGKLTNHLDLRKNLARGTTKAFLLYDVVTA